MSERRTAWELFGEPLEERFGQPVQRVTALTRKTMKLFPVRVWRHFLARNGLLLAASMSYQAIFAVFAAVFVGFSAAGLWLSGRPATMSALVDLVSAAVPGLIGDDGAITRSELLNLTSSSTTLLSWAGAVALGGLVWTAIGWVTYSRMSVRSVFGLSKDTRAYVLLKARDLIAALAFGLVMIVAAILTVVSTAALDWTLDVVGIRADSSLAVVTSRTVGLLLVVVIDVGVLATMFRFLSGAAITWRQLAGGSLLGGGALAVLQLLGGAFISTAGFNPLLAAFGVFIALLLWFRLTSVVILAAAAWITVAVGDRGVSLRRVSASQLEKERIEREQAALTLASKVRLRQAHVAYDGARWYAKPILKRRVEKAQAELDRVGEGGTQ